MSNAALEKIKEIVENFVSLEVVTLVTNIKVTTPKDPKEKTKYISEEKTIEKGCVTTIDIINGDIKNYIGTGLVDEEYDRVTKFHATQVEKGQEVIRSSISALKDAAQLIKDMTTS